MQQTHASGSCQQMAHNAKVECSQRLPLGALTILLILSELLQEKDVCVAALQVLPQQYTMVWPTWVLFVPDCSLRLECGTCIAYS